MNPFEILKKGRLPPPTYPEHDTKAAPNIPDLNDERKKSTLEKCVAEMGEFSPSRDYGDWLYVHFETIKRALGSAAQEAELVEALESLINLIEKCFPDATKNVDPTSIHGKAKAALAKYRAAPKEDKLS